MGFADLSSTDAVVEAVRECDQMGEQAFLEKYGFGSSRHVRLFYNGSDYPAKAILGVAHRFQFPEEGPLEPSQFTSGDSTINKFKQVGFDARSVAPTDSARLFVVRGGGQEEVVDYALENNVAATGWSEVGDVSLLDDETLDRELATAYDVRPSTLALWRAAVHAFREIRPGDWVILPITSKGRFAVGVVTGPHEYRPENHDLAVNCYPVRWLETDVPRDLLGDLRSRVDRRLAVHRITVEDAVPLLERALETRQPIRLRGAQRLGSLIEDTLVAIAAKDHETIKQRVDADIPAALSDLLPEQNPIGTGTGQATPADVPWVSVYPRDATASAKQGIYAVYLFAADGSAAYLSFIQGTENVAGGLPPLRKRTLASIRR